jgi:hypothetical protein
MVLVMLVLVVLVLVVLVLMVMVLMVMVLVMLVLVVLVLVLVLVVLVVVLVLWWWWLVLVMHRLSRNGSMRRGGEGMRIRMGNLISCSTGMSTKNETHQKSSHLTAWKKQIASARFWTLRNKCPDTSHTSKLQLTM